MFGLDNQSDQSNQDNVSSVVTPATPSADNASNDSAAASGAPAFDTSNVSLAQASSDPIPPAADETTNSPTNDSADTASDDTSSDNTSTVGSSTTTTPTADHDDVLTTGTDDDLLNIKQDALQQLSPLVDQLEQSPEEKFRTTMMMIQASDDQSLIKTAYDAAKGIKDDKARAQALLDIINEINYFTHQSQAADQD